MPYARPTLAEIRERTKTGMASRAGTGTLLRRSALAVQAESLAGVSHELHGHLEAVTKASFADTAVGDELARLARVRGVVRRPATYAGGLIEFTGENGAAIPAGTVIRRGDGETYTTVSTVVLTLGGASVGAVADLAGSSANSDAGTQMQFVNPVAAVNSAGVVLAPGIQGGTDQEGDEALRSRLLLVLGNPSSGGAVVDYINWALEVPGVERAWVTQEPIEFQGVEIGRRVRVQFTVSDLDGGPIPNAAQLAAVRDHIDAERPVAAQVAVSAPTLQVIDFEITIEPSTAELQLSIEASLADYLRNEVPPAGLVRISQIRELISTTPGEVDHTVIAPAGDVQLAEGALASLGTVTWV